ncbi:class I histocompatibility antigen, F10 alpha chain-like isoform X2 [Cetorhinus maximus]
MLLILFSISLCISWVSPDTDCFTVLYTGISGIPDCPEFVGVAMLNEVMLSYYDSDTMQMASRQQFITDYLNVENWDYLNRLGKERYDVMKKTFNTIMKGMNHTTGFHILQWIRTVNVTEDGSVQRSMRFGFDGKDYISLEPDSMRWFATNPNAVRIKEKWNSDESWNKHWEWQLEEELVGLLKKYLQVGKEYLRRKEIPENGVGHSQLGIIIGLTIAALLVIFGIIGTIIWKWQMRDSPSVTYTKAQTSDVSVPAARVSEGLTLPLTDQIVPEIDGMEDPNMDVTGARPHGEAEETPTAAVGAAGEQLGADTFGH